MTSIRRAVWCGLAAFPFILPSCDGDDDDGPTGSTGTIQIAVNPSTASVPAGGNSSVAVTLTRSESFSGVVTLTISGLPAGVSATMDPATLSGSTLISRIDLVSAETTVPGTSTVTINAASPGVASSSATFALTVTPQPNYTLSVGPEPLTIAAGGSKSTTINIDRVNFADGVALELVSPPAGITGTFAPSPSTTNTSTLTLTIGANVAAGSHPLTIRGTVSGTAQRTTSLALTVVPAPAAGNNVQYVYCDPAQAPSFFAYQDGSGPWQEVTGTVAGGATRFAFNLTSGRGGAMAVHTYTVDDGSVVGRRRSYSSPVTLAPSIRLRSMRSPSRRYSLAAVGDTYVTEVVYGSTAELAEDGALNCTLTLPLKDIRATVAGVAQFQYTVLSLGSASTIFEGGVSPNPITFSGVQDGPVNFTATRLPQTGSPPDRAIMLRNLNIPNGGTLPSTVDFNGPDAFVPSTATVNITGSTGEDLEVYNEVITTTGQTLFWNDIKPSTTASRPWAGLSQARMQPGDLHSVIVFASDPDTPDFRVTLKLVGPVSNQAIAFAPPVVPATVSQVSAGPYPRFRFQGSLSADYNKGVSLSLTAEDIGNEFSAIATSAYLAAAGAASAYDITMPDISSLTGFPLAARLTQGTNLATTDAFGFTGQGVFDVQRVVGAEWKASVRVRMVNVP